MAAIHTLSMLLTIIAVDRSAYHWTGAALATAILTKPQALAIAPVVVMLAAREGGFVRFSGAGLLMTAVITAPFLVAGQIGRVVQQYLHITEFDPVLAANAHNFWWLVSGGHGWQPDAAGFGPVSFRGVGLLLFAGATLLSALLVWRERRMVYLAASYQSLAFYMLNTEIHENHSLAMFAPLAIAAALDRRVWWLYGAFAFTALANMALHDPALLTWAGYPDIKEGAALAMPRWLNALAQILLFGAFTWKLIRHLRLGEPNDTERSIN